MCFFSLSLSVCLSFFVSLLFFIITIIIGWRKSFLLSLSRSRCYYRQHSGYIKKLLAPSFVHICFRSMRLLIWIPKIFSYSSSAETRFVSLHTMGCSNARLLVQTPLTETNPITGSATHHPGLATLVSSNETVPTSLATDANASTTRMHLTGVDLVVERNGTYTLLLTPKTHKQLMPYVLRKKRFR